MAARRRRGVAGLIPRVGGALWRGARWSLRHPQPFGLLVAAIGCAFGLWAFALHSDAFCIRQLRVPKNSPVALPESLMGQNIWAVDLQALSQRLHAQATQLKRVRVIRMLPDTLQVEVLERTPVAQVRLSQWHALDAAGFLFQQGSPRRLEHLVLLKGVETPREPLKVGRENTGQRLQFAMRLLDVLRRSPSLIGHRLTTIDVSDPGSLSLVIDEDIEIRCGSEQELRAQLDRLRTVLRMVAKQHLSIRYIDVRFTDPVIGPRT